MVRKKKWALFIAVLVTALALVGCLGIGRFQLRIDVVPEGSGLVERSPNQKNYEKNKAVDLKAVPAAGFKFSKWEGDLTSSNPTESVLMSKDLTIKAVFVPIDELTLDVRINPEGAGEIRISPDKPSYQYGEIIELEAIPAPSWGFTHWVGLDEQNPIATVEITENLVIKANFEIDAEAYVEGYVTDAQAGPAISGAEVIFSGQSTTTTNADGYFHLTVPAGQLGDILVNRPDGGATRIQGVCVEAGETVTYNQVPVRRSFHPGWSDTPPTVEVNVEPGQILTGIEEINVKLQSDMPHFAIYLYLNGEQRTPRIGQEFDSNELSVLVNTRDYPNGEGTLRILAYDDNEFAVLYVIPITIFNPKPTTNVLPSAIPYIGITAQTYNENIGYYSIPGDGSLLQSTKVFGQLEPQAAPPGCMMMVNMLWLPAPGADGYLVYRSFDVQTYNLIGTVPNVGDFLSFSDFSPQLEAAKQTFYRVVPYNSLGEGPRTERDVTPLPAMDIYLVSPANGTTGVDLQPTFEWEHASLDLFPEDALRQYAFSLFDATSWLVDEAIVNNETEYELSFELEPGKVYTWDIYNSQTYYEYSDDGGGFSEAISYGGYPNSNTGAKNGEFIFTTTLETDQNGGVEQ